MMLIPGNNLSVMVFAAGHGKRLLPLTEITPKPLLPFKGSCCLNMILSALKKMGFNRIHVNAHHLKDQIVKAVKNDPCICVHEEDEILETGGGLCAVLEYHHDYILTINADIWLSHYDDLHKLIESFDAGNMNSLLLLCPIENALKYTGKGDYDSSSSLPTFPIFHKKVNQEARYVFSGIQIMKKAFLENRKPNLKQFSMRHFFDIAEETETLWGTPLTAHWCDIGTLEIYHLLKNSK